MGIKDQFQDKANERKGQAPHAMSDSREQGHERGQRKDQERGGQRQDQGGQRPAQPRERERGQQGRQPAQDAMDAAEGRHQS
ncbi:hypothetical protein GCM10012285_51260 [Streptomyces kronopolitis]|uniref:Uncharacterized protein n=1 Tax=Streptomyces kronopolitis TaxID=1612435 RepID=A0ABQ2JVL9_9ACTN|nr:hypothetical protein [Streptomyces kronopolitis]GGN56579.1 hypothetical protein GCM10012285_51260 [Streptomyces kronopolitis]